MTRDSLNLLDRLSSSERLACIARLAYELTVAARIEYRDVNEPDISISNVTTYNEMLHLVIGKLLSEIGVIERAYPNEAFLNSLLDFSGRLRIRGHILRALESCGDQTKNA